jgi:hypothetical protein
VGHGCHRFPFLWLVTKAETLVPTVTFSSRENLLHESCTDRICRLALITLPACELVKKLGNESAIEATSASMADSCS